MSPFRANGSEGDPCRFRRFLGALAETGRVRVGPEPPADAEVAGARDLIEERDAAARRDAPFDAPPLVMGAAAWAAVAVYRACQLLSHRELGADVVRESLGKPSPEAPSPAVIYSVDLYLRHLVDLVPLARAQAEGDPLVGALLALARAWPLSSVGVKGVGPVDARAVMGHPTTAALYVDRIIARGDTERLADPAVRDAVKAALGLHAAELAPALAAALAAAVDPDPVPHPHPLSRRERGANEEGGL